MARNQEPINVPYNEWVELTNSDITEITFQVLSGQVEIRVAGSDEPDADARGWSYIKRDASRRINLTDIAAAGGTRLWAHGVGYPYSKVLVDHA